MNEILEFLLRPYGIMRRNVKLEKFWYRDATGPMMDEATSALDNLTQKKVSDALGKYKSTRIVIAHRLSTIRQCDRIIVLDQGRIIEDGSYDKLMKKNGFFAELVSRQQLDAPNE